MLARWAEGTAERVAARRMVWASAAMVLVALASTVVSVLGNSLCLRLNAFAALEGAMQICQRLVSMPGVASGRCHGSGTESPPDPFFGALVGAEGTRKGAHASQEVDCSGVGHTHGDILCTAHHGHSHSHIHNAHEHCERTGCVPTSPACCPSARGVCVPPPAAFPFAGGRLPVLVGFAAATISLFAAITTVVEGLQRLLQPHDAAPALAELLAAFHIGVVIGGRHWAAGPREDLPVQGTLRRIVPPLVCVANSAAISLSGLPRVDVLAATLLALFIGRSAAAELTGTMAILVGAAPAEGSLLALAAKRGMTSARQVTGVMDVRGSSVWQVEPTRLGAHLHVVLADGAHEQMCLVELHEVLGPVFAYLFIQCHKICQPTHTGHSHPTVLAAAFPAPPTVRAPRPLAPPLNFPTAAVGVFGAHDDGPHCPFPTSGVPTGFMHYPGDVGRLPISPPPRQLATEHAI